MNFLDEIQYQHLAWSRMNFGDIPSWQPLIGMQEELGELSHAHLKEAQDIRKVGDFDEAKKDAIGDIVIFMLDYCNRSGYILSEIIEETWDLVSKRNWKRYPKNGVSE